MSADQLSLPKKSFSSKELGPIESAGEVFVVEGVQLSFLRHRVVIVDVVVHVVLLFVLFCCTCCSVVHVLVLLLFCCSLHWMSRCWICYRRTDHCRQPPPSVSEESVLSCRGVGETFVIVVEPSNDVV